jgi:hypothetical protein
MELVRGMRIEIVETVAENLSLSREAMETVSIVKRLGGIPIIVIGRFNALALATYKIGYSLEKIKKIGF